MFGDQRRIDKPANCTRTPFATACREKYCKNAKNEQKKVVFGLFSVNFGSTLGENY